MKCPKCEFKNPDGVKFCGQCGVKLESICPNCNSSSPPQFRFCGECGFELTTPSEALGIDYDQPQSYTPKHLAKKILTTRDAIEGERKLLTVLFADVADSTSLGEKLDPEEVHQIMDGCFKIMMDEIHGYEGTINQFRGDGAMALFGAPLAHEDHAQRACHAALAIQRSLQGYNEEIKRKYGLEFRMRVGLNSGTVVVGSIGDDLRMDYTADGDTTNLAARVQEAANPGEVWVSEDTHGIIKDYFEDEMVGEIPMKGIAEPQPAYRLVSERGEVRTRFEAALVRGMTDLVGRRPEMEALKSAFENVKEGRAQVVDIVGEAGIGKSRLVYEFQKSLGTDVMFLPGFCVHYGQNMNFLPLIDIFNAAFEIKEGMGEEEVGSRIEERAKGDLLPMVPFFRSLLSLKVDDPNFNTLNPEGRKFGTFEAAKNLLVALSTQRPLIVFLEDVHWMDKISEEFFTYFARCIPEYPILMLSAYRPEGMPAWAQGPLQQRLDLDTLSSESSLRLVRNILGGMALESGLEQRIVQNTEGNPFFVEEIVRELVDGGDIVQSGDQYVPNRFIDQIEIPNTVQGVLAARMDRLSEGLKGTMQVASVIGRDFAFRLLKTIMELGEELRRRLTNLVGLQILYEKALYPELEYIFKHALIQEVAYESLLKQKRREIHGRIGQAIEELYAERLEEHFEILAYHYERSERAEKAIEYLILAGEKSNRNQASKAANQFFSKVFEVSKAAHISLAPETEVQAHKGVASARADMHDIGTAFTEYSKAVEISRKHGMTDRETDGLAELGFCMWFSTTGSEEAIRFYDDAIARAQEVGDKAAESRILSWKGMYVSSLGQRYKGHLMTADAETMALPTKNLKAILTGRFTRAITERWMGNPRKTIELTAVMPESMAARYNTTGHFIRGLALAETGRITEAMGVIEQGIDICEKFGAALSLGRLYNTLGYCYMEICHPEKALGPNQQSEMFMRKLMEQFPMGRHMAAEVVAQASVNLMENLFDQGKTDQAWDRMQSFNEASRGSDYDKARDRWDSRMNILAARILLERNEVHEAEILIEKYLEYAQREHMRKHEGSLLRLLGEVQVKLNYPEKALETMGQAIAILKDVGNPRQLWQAYASRAQVFSEMGRSSEAREEWQAAASVVESTTQGLQDETLRTGFINAAPVREIMEQASS